MLAIHIIHRHDQSFALRITCAETEIFKAAVATLKAMIPAALRFFDFRMRYWIISPEAESQLPAFLSRMQAIFSADVEVVSETDTERESREATERAGRQEHERREGEGTDGTDSRQNGHRRLRVARRLNTESAYRTLYLAPGAPLEVVQAVYRTLAKLHHPDVGGSTEVMAEINDAYNYLVGSLKKDEHVA